MAGNVPHQNETNLLRLVQSIRELYAGRSNAIGTMTCTTGAATTTVTATNCGQGSAVVMFPNTANAATEMGNGTVYVSAVNNGTFVVTHANSATASRTFAWIAMG